MKKKKKKKNSQNRPEKPDHRRRVTSFSLFLSPPPPSSLLPQSFILPVLTFNPPLRSNFFLDQLNLLATTEFILILILFLSLLSFLPSFYPICPKRQINKISSTNKLNKTSAKHDVIARNSRTTNIS